MVKVVWMRLYWKKRDDGVVVMVLQLAWVADGNSKVASPKFVISPDQK